MQIDLSLRDIFLCHSSKDKEYVRRLAQDLEAMGVKPWFSDWELQVGDSLFDRIGQAINSAGLFCIVLSTNSQNSRWCREELSEALSNAIDGEKNNVLVVRKGKVPVPPFLKSRLFIDAPRYSLKVPLSLAFRTFGLSPKDIDLFALDKRKLVMERALEILAFSAREKSRHFGLADWTDLRVLLERRDFPIDHDDSLRITSLKHGKSFIAT